MVRFFADAESASDYQAQRELQEALAVQQMGREEFSRWLSENWGRLQKNGLPALANDQRVINATARCFGSLEEKNSFDEAVEIEQAQRIASRRGLM